MNFSEALAACVFRLRRSHWHELVHVQLHVVALPALAGPGAISLPNGRALRLVLSHLVTLREPPDGIVSEVQFPISTFDHPDYEPWTQPDNHPGSHVPRHPPEDWPTYDDGPVGWWFAMHGKNPDPADLHHTAKDLRAAFAVWYSHPNPKTRCECGHVYRPWDSPRVSGGEMACANPRCDQWGITHDGHALGRDDELLMRVREGVREGVLRSKKETD